MIAAFLPNLPRPKRGNFLVSSSGSRTSAGNRRAGAGAFCRLPLVQQLGVHLVRRGAASGIDRVFVDAPGDLCCRFGRTIPPMRIDAAD